MHNAYAGVDVETTLGVKGPPYAIGIYTPAQSHYFSVKPDPFTGAVKWPRRTIAKVNSLLRNVTCIGHNFGLFDKGKLESVGVRIRGYEDTQNAMHTLDSSENLRLKYLADKYLGISRHDESDLSAKVDGLRSIILACRRRQVLRSDSCGHPEIAPSHNPTARWHCTRCGELFRRKTDWKSAFTPVLLRYGVDSWEKVDITAKYALGDNNKSDMWLVAALDPTDTLTEQYCILDCKRTYELFLGSGELSTAISQHGQQEILRSLNRFGMYRDRLDLHPTIVSMQDRGIPLSKSRAAKLRKQLVDERYDIMLWAKSIDLNPQSVPSVRTFLFDTLGLTPVNTTDKGAASTDMQTLYELSIKAKSAAAREACGKLFKFRRINKGLENLDTLLSQVDADGILHPDFIQTGTRTTRWSCREPNMQNVAKPDDKDPDKIPLRCLFSARKGYQWISIDYSQLELRIFAWLANEPQMQEWFLAGIDGHQWTGDEACKQAGLTKLIGTKSARSVGKTLNFGTIYGAQAERVGLTICDSLRIYDRSPIAVGNQMLALYYKTFPPVKTFMSDTQRMVRYQGKVYTAYGYPLCTDKEHAGANYRVQGTAGGVLEQGMRNIIPVMAKYGIKPIIQVHDELNFEVPKGTPKAAIRELAAGMEDNKLEGLVTPVDISLCYPTWQTPRKWR